MYFPVGFIIQRVKTGARGHIEIPAGCCRDVIHTAVSLMYSSSRWEGMVAIIIMHRVPKPTF